MAETSRRWSTYNYVENNPIRFIDPDGMSSSDTTKNKKSSTGADGLTNEQWVNKYNPFTGSEISMGDKTDKEKYDENLSELEKKYPKLKDQEHKHHKKPKHHGGTPNDETVPIPAPYHQGITNEFRKQWGYSPNPKPSDQESDEVQEKVYDQFPLPPFDENGKSTHTNIAPPAGGLPTDNNSFVQKISNLTGLTGVALGVYIVISEGSRLFPPRNLVPIP